ncbi:MAG TPA: tRNA dihydrouridine synthase DusB [Steroidobacteraceae bacterium]|nr:tRNA dihydrouridine synthase DusB [Steroidobacteraceae bacterium]
MKIGRHELRGRALLAPMAGVTDRPFRMLCRRFGAALAASEMVTSDTSLWHTDKSRRRLDHSGEAAPRVVQIAGGEASMMAEAARLNADAGAEIIDINMGCPAKKVCNRAAGSALLRDPALVAGILEAVVGAVDVPVTLKIRTGWSPEERNALLIARIAEDAGIQALAVHGRTRACHFAGSAEHWTAAEIKSIVKIPVVANGDIRNARDAAEVLQRTGVDAVMIGRAAQGQPWIFSHVNALLETEGNAGKNFAPVDRAQVRAIIRAHLESLYEFYGDETGVRVARKHFGWYCRQQPGSEELRRAFVAASDTGTQLALAGAFGDVGAADLVDAA